MSNRVQKWNVGPERRKERETFCGRFGKRTPFLRLRAQLQDVRQKDRSQEWIHSVKSFCFVVFLPQSLLAILESRVVKRMAINHCVEVDAYKYGDAPERKRLGTSRAKSFTVRRIWDVGIANNVEWSLYRTFWNEFPALVTLYFEETHAISAIASSTTQDTRANAQDWITGPE